MKTELTNLIIQLRYDRMKRSKKEKIKSFDDGLGKLGITLPSKEEKVTCNV